jgi:L-alanine-DL-glutamate epimerase-like enolase superfamily enzyme
LPPFVQITLKVTAERWPIAGSFTISRGAKTEALVVVVELGDGRMKGRGECVPYARYGESVDSVIAAIEAMRGALAAGLGRTGLQTAMRPVPPAMRWIARSGTLRPSKAIARCMNWPVCRHQSR